MQIRNAQRLVCYSLLSLTGVAFSSSVFAAGFALRNHSASGVGTSLASDTVNTFDASGLLSNPAIMSQFKGGSLSLNVNYTNANISAKDASLTPGPQLLAGGLSAYPVAGASTQDDVSKPVTIPSLFSIYQVSEQVHVGWSFNVPYGTNTEYDNDWAGRYHGTKTMLQAYDVALHASYKIDDVFAAGISLDWQQAKGELASAADLGSAHLAITRAQATAQAQAGQITAAQAQAATVAAAGQVGRRDALATYKGDSTAFGFGVGFLVKPMEGTRLGLSYKSQIKHEAKGDFKWEATTADAATTLNILKSGQVTSVNAERYKDSSDAKLDITLPAVTSLGVAQDFADFTVYFNATHTAWSSIYELNPEYNGQSVETQTRWNDSMYYAIGGDYRFDPSWTFRVGIGHDQGVVDPDHRSPRTPDGDRTAMALGTSYKMGSFDFSAAVQKLFLEDTKSQLNASAYPDNNSRGTFKSTYEIDPLIAVVSAGYSF